MTVPTRFDIQGIRTRRITGVDKTELRTPRPLLPNGDPASWFSVYFKSIFAELDKYYWLLSTSEGFNWLWEETPHAQRISELLGIGPDSEDDDDEPPPSGIDRFLHAPRLITEIAPYVRDDWNALHGFRQLPADPDCVVRLYDRDERSPELLNQVDVLFENWDGAFWLLYTKNAALIDKVREDWRDEPAIRIEPVSYQEMMGQFDSPGLFETLGQAIKRRFTRRRD